MARWATQCIIGSADFSNCRVELVNAGGFLSANTGSVDFANDGTPIVQTVQRDRRGVRFGLKMVSAQDTILSTMLADIATAEALNQAVRGRITDGIITVDIWLTPDYGQEQWFTWDRHSEGFYEDLTLQFISKGDHT